VINEGLKARSLPLLTLSRAQDYICAMVDDLTHLVVSEPSRLFPSRPEFRLSLLDDDSLYRESGRRARLRVEQLFDAEQNSRQLHGQILKCARPAKVLELRGSHVGVS